MFIRRAYDSAGGSLLFYKADFLRISYVIQIFCGDEHYFFPLNIRYHDIALPSARALKIFTK